jgi:DNA replication and repair protein RecF
LNNAEVRRYASQGQHKTFLIALNIAKFFFIRDKNSETPVFLLDDIFTELDADRSQKFLDFIIDIGQTFITATDLNMIPSINPNKPIRKFFVNSGVVYNA